MVCLQVITRISHMYSINAISMAFSLVRIRLPSPLDLQVYRHSTDEEHISNICRIFENLRGLLRHLWCVTAYWLYLVHDWVLFIIQWTISFIKLQGIYCFVCFKLANNKLSRTQSMPSVKVCQLSFLHGSSFSLPYQSVWEL